MAIIGGSNGNKNVVRSGNNVPYLRTFFSSPKAAGRANVRQRRPATELKPIKPVLRRFVQWPRLDQIKVEVMDTTAVFRLVCQRLPREVRLLAAVTH